MAYKKTTWKDHIENADTGEIIQKGTIITAELLNNIENWISEKDAAISAMQTKITALETEVELLTTLTARVESLESWKTSARNGSDVLLVKVA